MVIIILTDYIQPVINQIPIPTIQTVETIIKELAECDWRDTYGKLSPGDSDLWLQLIKITEQEWGNELARRLLHLRNHGSVLVPSEKYGYMIRPVIGPGGWMSQQEYERATAPITQYQSAVGILLGRLKRNDV